MPSPYAPSACELPTCFRHISPSSSAAVSARSSGSVEESVDFKPVLVVPSAEDLDRQRVVKGLTHEHDHDRLTIGTLTSADTIPLGTDFDPGHYNNLWLADQISDPNGKLLVQYNLCCRVIDAENLGFSYGSDVLGKRHCYDVEGVNRAVAHFQKQGVEVVVVGKRQDLGHFGDDVTVVRAERTDDLMVLKQAHSRNCPIVSRDGFAAWKTDLRVDKELRQWLSDSADLQVRFSWGAGGHFVTDFDLPRPCVQPSSWHGTRAA